MKYFEINVSVPVKSEEYLEFVYGTNWRNPVKKFNWIKDSPSVKNKIMKMLNLKKTLKIKKL